MSLASLPHRIPFTLGGLVRPAETKAVGFTGVLPKRLPFTLSAKVSEPEIPYGSIGWELICRSYDNFQTELLRTTDMNSLTFSKELSAYGAASFSLNLDHPLFQQALNDGSSIETLFDYENLWEIRFDGSIVFQILGTAVTDSSVNESETRTASVSGSGTGKVLEWAQIFPIGFPDNIVTKLETLTDDFSGGALDLSIWKHTAVSSSISTTSQGSYQEARAELDQLQQERENLTVTKNNAQTSYNQEKVDYAAVMKDKTSTANEKKEATKQLNEATTELAKANKDLANNQAKITQATQRISYIGIAKSDETFGHAKITMTGPGISYITSGTYNLESSGISAGVEPAPSLPTQDGQIATVFKISHDPGYFEDYYFNTRDYARMYTQRITDNLRIVAEVANNNNVLVEDWAYDPDDQKFWRIREDSGYLIFDTSPDNETWTRRFRSRCSWASNNVFFQFGVELQGLVGITPPLSAYLFALNSSEIPPTETTMQLFRKYLASAQGRAVIPYVKTDFTDKKDSRGLNWSGKLATDLNEGTNLSAALTSLTELQQADWIMDPDFTLRAFQRTKTDETIPPVYFLRDDVVFHEGGSQISKERSRNRDGIANAIVGRTATGEYAYVEDQESMGKYQRREAFISAGTAADVTQLASLLDSSIEELKAEKVSWKVVVAGNQPGRRVFKDYDIGDWIRIENIDSNHNISIGLWRVVGIAVSVAPDANITVELTLQSRKELLIERLKQQVANLSAGAGTSNTRTTLGSAINAATLIEQITLAGLKDVAIFTPVEGDVLTYSHGFWVPLAPGDKTVPDVPAITGIASNVYYPETGVSTKAQIQIDWTTPFNTDGSLITDGHHFEIRFRPDTTLPYSATWLEAEQFDWNELYTWNQPTIPPIENAGWQTLFVGFDQNTAIVQELTPGVSYEFQIRAVDSSTPQHWSEWSVSTLHEAAQDQIAPPQPAVPFVASSRLGIQVTHYLGLNTGGQFNLPPDMSHLEVHVSNASFFPSSATYVGKIVADVSIIRGRTPVIQTFQIDNTDNVWVRVIAVDKTGNKSSPSGAVTAQVNLIDDAHISDLTASKITAGIISSAIILSGVIKTAESGPRAEMNFQGFRIYGNEEDPSVSLLSTPTSDGNFLLIKDPVNSAVTLAGIDGTGRGSFQSLTVSDDITIEGENLISDIIDPRPKGVISIGTWNNPVTGAGVGVERGFLEISFIAEESRTYMITAVTQFESTSSANERMIMRFRDGGEGDPSLSLPYFQESTSSLVGGAGVNSAANITYTGTFEPGLHRILWSFRGQLGNCTVNALGGSINAISLIWVEDIGIPKTDTVIFNDAGVPAQGGPSSGASPKPKVEYTKTYSCNWSGTYRGQGDYVTEYGSTMVQGTSGTDPFLGDARSLMGFDYVQIMKDLAGATVKACYVTLYANHWYWNDGGTARLGTHNYTNRPGAMSLTRCNKQRLSVPNWPKPGKKKVALPLTLANDFKSGVAKGLMLGPTDGTQRQFGKFNGDDQSNEPTLTIIYVK